MTKRTRRFITLADGSKVHYTVQGQTGPWLVCLNGLFADTSLWSAALPVLSSRHRVLRLDFLGQGASDPLPDHSQPCPPSAWAMQAQAVMQALEIERPWLLGVSNGSNTALELLSSRPHDFAGAVLCASMPCVDLAVRLKIQHWMTCLQKGDWLMQFEAAAPLLWGDRFLERQYFALRSLYTELSITPSHHTPSAYAHMAGLLHWDIRPRLANITAPVLVLSGAEDLLTPPWKCLATAQAIPHARFEVVPQVGHAYPLETPRPYGTRVIEWIATCNSHS